MVAFSPTTSSTHSRPRPGHSPKSSSPTLQARSQARPRLQGKAPQRTRAMCQRLAMCGWLLCRRPGLGFASAISSTSPARCCSSRPWLTFRFLVRKRRSCADIWMSPSDRSLPGSSLMASVALVHPVISRFRELARMSVRLRSSVGPLRAKGFDHLVRRCLCSPSRHSTIGPLRGHAPRSGYVQRLSSPRRRRSQGTTAGSEMLTSQALIGRGSSTASCRTSSIRPSRTMRFRLATLRVLKF